MQFRLNVPPFTRVLLALLVAGSVGYQTEAYRTSYFNTVPWIALTPQLSMFYPWTYITATFAEHNVVTLAIATATIFYGGKYLERAWGSMEFGKFILVATLVPNLVASILYGLAYATVLRSGSQLASIHGSISIQAAFLVAFKQLVPEHTVTILRGLIKVRVKHFPAIFLIANTISGVLFFTDTAAVLSWVGFISSWTYLRFYKAQPDLSGTSTGGPLVRGDASETFAFAYFWPDVVHGPVAALSDTVFNVLVAVRLCTPFSAEAVETSNQQANSRGDGLPNIMNAGGRRGGGSKREEAERRRALALKALDQRMQAASANRPAQAPTSVPSAHAASLGGGGGGGSQAASSQGNAEAARVDSAQS